MKQLIGTEKIKNYIYNAVKISIDKLGVNMLFWSHNSINTAMPSPWQPLSTPYILRFSQKNLSVVSEI